MMLSLYGNTYLSINLVYRISPFFIYIAIRNYVRIFCEVRRHDKSGHVQKRDAATNFDPEEHSKRKKKKKKGKDNDEGTKNDEKAEDVKGSDKAKKNNPEIYDAMHKAFRVAIEVHIILC